MSEPDIRIGDTEREEALKALGEHMSAGRLELDEYGDRSAQVTTSKTRRDLLALFVDLPEPHPRFGEVVRPAAPAPVVAKQEPGAIPPVARRLANALVPVTGLVCVLLFLTVVKSPLIFLLVPIIAILAGSITGDQRGRDRDRRRRR